MDIVHARAAGMDISKRDAKVCLLIPGKRAGTYTSSVTTWGATMASILEPRDFLEHEHVTVVAMEASSDYWKPFFYLLEETLPVVLVNAKAARSIPGRKTDVSDAAWLAQLAAHGLIRGSFVPPEPIRELRDPTRPRSIDTRDRAQEIQRLEKFSNGRTVCGVDLWCGFGSGAAGSPFVRCWGDYTLWILFTGPHRSAGGATADDVGTPLPRGRTCFT